MAARRGSRYPTQPDAMRTVRIGRQARYCTMVSILLLVLTRIVGGIEIFKAQRTNGRYLGDVLTGFCPVEVGCIAGQNDDATGRICFHPIAVELITQADVENAGHDRVHSVLRVSVWPHLHAGGHFDPDHVGARLWARRGDRPRVLKARRTGRTSPRGPGAEAAARASRPATWGRRPRSCGSRRRGHSRMSAWPAWLRKANSSVQRSGS